MSDKRKIITSSTNMKRIEPNTSNVRSGLTEEEVKKLLGESEVAHPKKETVVEKEGALKDSKDSKDTKIENSMEGTIAGKETVGTNTSKKAMLGEGINILLAIVGASGSGKTYLTEKVLGAENKVITYTTRVRRESEEDGVDYHFLGEEEFLRREKEGYFLDVVKYGGNYYGISKDSVAKIEGMKYIITTYEGYLSLLTAVNNYVVGIYIDSEKDKRVSLLKSREGEEKSKELLNSRSSEKEDTGEIKNRLTFCIKNQYNKRSEREFLKLLKKIQIKQERIERSLRNRGAEYYSIFGLLDMAVSDRMKWRRVKGYQAYLYTSNGKRYTAIDKDGKSLYLEDILTKSYLWNKICREIYVNNRGLHIEVLLRDNKDYRKEELFDEVSRLKEEIYSLKNKF